MNTTTTTIRLLCCMTLLVATNGCRLEAFIYTDPDGSTGHDAGLLTDAAPDPDGATGHDAGLLTDAAPTADAAPGQDAGTAADAAVLPDAATPPDAAVLPDSGVVITDPLIDRIRTVTSTTPEGVKSGVSNWRIWGTASLYIAPVFTVPLANCETLVCYTSSGGGTITPQVARLNAVDQLVTTHSLTAGHECRGLAAEPTGEFAALLWDDAADAIFVTRYDANGVELWSEELTNATNTPDDFNIGDSRLEYGDGRYGAYYHVHSNTGHEGDTLKWVTVAGVESTGWSWGCSHSMSAVLRYNPTLSTFLPACVTDCYPGTSGGPPFTNTSIGGLYLNHNTGPVLTMDAGCNGSVAGELGSGAIAPNGWKLVFNAHQAATTLGQSSYNSSTMNQDIGFASIASNLGSSAVVWLTSTASINEADATIARWEPAGDPTEQYVVGWSEPSSGYVYQLARVDAAGALLEGPVDISAQAEWGRRDDPMRQHYNGDVVWAWFDSPGSTTLNFARLVSGGTYSCTTF